MSISNRGGGIKERDLAGHLSNGEDAVAIETSSALLETDFQLYEALNLLKGLVLVGSNKR